MIYRFFDLKDKEACQRHDILLTPHKCVSTQCGVLAERSAIYMCRRHNILLTPHKCVSTQCGGMTMHGPNACRMHATTTSVVAYLRYAEFYCTHFHPKLRYRLLGVNRISCFQHANINTNQQFLILNS